MPRDFLEELAEAPVPPVPATFNLRCTNDSIADCLRVRLWTWDFGEQATPFRISLAPLQVFLC